MRVIGATVIAVLPGNSDDTGPPAAALGIVVETLTAEDLEAMRNKNAVPHLEAASGYVRSQATIQAGRTARTEQLEGVSPSYTQVENSDISSGRFFSEEDNARRAKVTVLGTDIAKSLFPFESPIGQTIKVNNVQFSVIGVFASRGASLFSNPDETVYIPLETAQKTLLNRNYLDAVRGRVDEQKNIARTQEDLRVLLRARHNIADPENDDFSVRSIDSALGILTNITNILTYFLVGVAAVSLLVGGIGVMNIMFIAASQRVREIGLRKSIGARSQDIFFQFVFESVILSFVGGIVGFVIGVVVTALVSLGVNAFGYEWQFLVPLDAALWSFVIVFVIGVVFGSYPARKASKISPIEALRYE